MDNLMSYIRPGGRRRGLRGLEQGLNNVPVVDDYIARNTMTDVYPGRIGQIPPPDISAPQQQYGQGGAVPAQQDIFSNLTVPGVRPTVIQKGVSFTIPVTQTPVPLTNQPFYCETILINPPSSLGNSVFYGFGSSITTASGEEIQPGVPQVFTTDNTREQWELQRPLEAICNMIAGFFGLAGLAPMKSPRVVWNTNDWYLVAGVAGPSNVSVTLFYTPEMQ